MVTGQEVITQVKAQRVIKVVCSWFTATIISRVVLLCHQDKVRNLLYVPVRDYFYQESPGNKNGDEVNLRDQQGSFSTSIFSLTTEAEPASETSCFARLKIMEALETTYCT